MNPILVIAKLTDTKLKDKLYPLKKAFPNKKIFVLRRMKGIDIDNVEYISLSNPISRHGFLGTFFILLKAFFLLKQINPSLIISFFFVPHGLMSIILGKIFKKNVICSIIGSDQIKLEKGLFSNLYLNLLKKSSCIVVTGSTMYKKLQNKIKQSNKINVIPNTKKIIPNFRKIEEKDIDFIFIGRLIKLKQIDIIIDSFNRYLQKNKAKRNLFIIGDGPESIALVERVTKYNLKDQISFTGYQRNVTDFLRRSKFILLASSIEGLPAVLIEGMMNGCIPITTNVGDISDIVSAENGFLIDHSLNAEPEILIERFAELFEKVMNIDSQILNQYSLKNIEKSKQFDYSIGGNKWKQIIKKLNV